MRLTAPPRRVAAQVKLDALMMAGWALAAVALLILFITTIDHIVVAGAQQQLAVPVLSVIAVGAALSAVVAKPSWVTGVAYLAVGAGAVLSHSSAMQAAGATDGTATHHLVLALCLLGAVTGRELAAIAWSTAGLLIGQGTLLASQVLFGLDHRPNISAFIVYVGSVAICLMLWRTRRVEQRLITDGPDITAEIIRNDDERMLANRAAAIVHETILSDLALVAHGPALLAVSDRQRLHRDLETVGARPVASRTQHTAMEIPRNDFYDIVREFQWHGLTIDVGGNSFALELLDEHGREAILGAMRASLDNVLRHSGQSSAEIFVDQSIDRLTVMIVDEGRGFALERVADDRLGLRMAIMQRIEDCGGSVTVWSSPGAGTSVVISLPVGDAAREERRNA